MGMTQAQAEKLGQIIAKARARKGLSTRALAEQVGVATGWITGIETGRFAGSSPDRLARLCDVLDIAPGTIDRLTKGAVTDGLPSGRTYFRAKYDLSPEQVEKVERYIQRMRKDAA